MQQAWFDVEIKKSFAIRVGKFKTPFSHAYLTTLGETLMPTLPTSLTSSVILPYSLNAVTPNIGMGFDLGQLTMSLQKQIEKAAGNHDDAVVAVMKEVKSLLKQMDKEAS